MDAKNEAYEAYLRAQTAEYDANMRSPAHLWSSVAIIAATPFSLLIPGAREAIGISFFEAAPILLSVIVVAFVTTAVYHRLGQASTAYRMLDHFETLSVPASLGSLIVLSGTAVSPLWLFYLGHLFVVSIHPSLSRPMRALIGGMPLFVALAFLIMEGPRANFFSSLVAASMAALTMSFSSALHARLSRMAFERGMLEKRVAELEVEGERRRIARDLHDGLTADLTAIAWRAEVLAKSPGDANPVDELGAIARRARAAIDDTRSVVWALRDQEVAWGSLIEHIRSRCLDLCDSRAALELELEPADQVISGQLAVDIVRIVQESVRNALQHGGPSTVTVKMVLGETISLTIDDDGVGLDIDSESIGGLHNVALRAKSHAGEVQLDRLDPGTRVHVTLPLSI
jgi:signal transduction histidine kinase